MKWPDIVQVDLEQALHANLGNSTDFKELWNFSF